MQTDHADAVTQAEKLKNRSRTAWLSAGILFVLVLATAAVVGTCLHAYTHQSDCAISLYEGEIAVKKRTAIHNAAAAGTSDSAVTESRAAAYTGSEARTQMQPAALSTGDTGMADSEQVWTTETSVALFQTSYANADGEVTVRSGGSDKVIAPGTEGSYTFELQNTGGAADYKIWVEAYESVGSENIPLQARMSGEDGWLLGGKDSWLPASELNGISEERHLDAGKNADYTIYWQWPFEREADGTDTDLGNLSVGQNLTYTVTIYTLTSGYGEAGGTNADENQNPIIRVLHAVRTGDAAPVLLWIVVLLAAAGVIIFLLLRRKKEEKSDKNADE